MNVGIFFYKVGQTLRGLTSDKSYMRTKKDRREYLIVVDDVSPATVPEILPATCELRWDFPEEEGMMQYSRDKYFP